MIRDALYVVVVIAVAAVMLAQDQVLMATTWVLGTAVGFVFGDLHRKKIK